MVANKDFLNNIELPHLKKVLFCGEVMPNKQLNYWRSHVPHALYANLYGPTEITDVCTYYIIDREFTDDEPLPLGYPCENTDILILDEKDNLVTEQDVQGELCVRGTSLSHGYWNNPEKTKEVFCQNPLNPHYPERIYRTGDLAHYNERGEIMFDGRKDFQIKHMGNRIELGEIETAASVLQGVETVSSDYDTDKKEIVLFYLGDASDKEIRILLLKHLPKYMVPTRYIKLDKFPYNDNGKIDRKSLKNQYIKG
jgi:non-ribosomal peptide synthetase component F